MKKIISMVLFISVFCSLCVPISAVALETHADDSVIYYVEQEIREQDIQRQINEILAELNKREFQLYGRDPDAFDYYTEIVTFDTRRVTKGGYAGGQLPGGVCFGTAGGSFFYSRQSSNATTTASVSFSVPIKLVTVSFDFGTSVPKTSSNIANNINVDKSFANDYVKLYITQTNYYKTNKQTGERVALLTTAYPSTLYSEKYDIKVV